MRGKKISIGLFAVILAAWLMAGTCMATEPENVLHSFNPSGANGSQPFGGLIADSAGNLYGTTAGGGEYAFGTAFELSPREGGGWTETVLHSFGNGTDGTYPVDSLIFDAAGNLYGTTSAGGSAGRGTVFELSPTAGGNWNETVLYAFGKDDDGGFPMGSLIFDADGNLYGTTQSGNVFGTCGTVFELSPSVSGIWTETILKNFCDDVARGDHLEGGVVFDAAGNLYGTTSEGVGFLGTVYELSPTAGGVWTETTLHKFSISDGDTSGPYCGVIFDSAGNLYGTSLSGGSYGLGMVFELSPSASGIWEFRMLHAFGNGTDGRTPEAGLIFDAAGNLYGTTSAGGSAYNGTVFELSPTAGSGWTEKVLHNFGKGIDGELPGYGSLIFDAAGNLYGTTAEGGAYGNGRSGGTVFKITR
jgi:uncharacterized repeat protein (TIGR03803 family)